MCNVMVQFKEKIRYLMGWSVWIFDYFIEKVSLKRHLVFFGVMVIIFAFFYWVLTPVSHGIGCSGEPLGDSSFWTSLYFSVVTISSLGYGDMQPLGISRILACAEVLLGLALMGIVVAKITSRRLSYHVRRLFSAESQKRLEELSSQTEGITSGYRGLMLEVDNLSTPGASLKEFNEDFASAVRGMETVFINVCEYLSYEVDHGDYFTEVPSEAIARLGGGMHSNLLLLHELLGRLPSHERSVALQSLDMSKILSAMNSLREVGTIVKRHAVDEGVLFSFEKVMKIERLIYGQYLVVPAPIAEELPDQVAEDDYDYI